jgi:hypothetical protein
MLMAELYYNAAELERLYGLLVIKNSYLIAERYFNESSIEQKAQLQSATKSYTSALVGIALDQGCLSSMDQKMMDFFPEFADQITDPRKGQITMRDMLQMRAITAIWRPIGWGSLWHGRVIKISSHTLRSIFSCRLTRRWAIGYRIGMAITSA